MRLFLTSALLLSLWWAKAQIIPLTISEAENKLDWREAVFYCWDEYKVSRIHPCVMYTLYDIYVIRARVRVCVRACVRACVRV